MTNPLLEQLAGKVEGLSGACRETDAELATSLGWKDVYRVGERSCDAFVGRDPATFFMPVPAYTASLDAAMTLVDPTWFFHISRFSPEGDGRGQAHIYPNRGLGDDYEGDAATVPLALVSAALKARAVQP